MIKGKQFVFLYEIDEHRYHIPDSEACLRFPGPAVMELASDPGKFRSSKYQTSS